MPRQFTVNADTLQAFNVPAEELSDDTQATLDALGPMRPVPSHGPDESGGIRDLLQWGGKAIGGAFFGPAGVEAAESPGLTLATAAIPVAAQHAWGAAKEAFMRAAPSLKTGAATAALLKGGVSGALLRRLIRMLPSEAKAAQAAPESVPVPKPSPTAHVPANASGTQWGHVNPASIAAETPAAARASQAASPRAVPAPPAAPEVPPPVPTRADAPSPSPGLKVSAQRIRNEVGLAERRAGLKLTEGQREQADRLVAQGTSPKEAVQAVAEPATAPPMTTATPASQAPAATIGALRPRLTAAEVKEYQRMIQAGKTPNEAQEAIELQRQFAQQYKTPSVEQAFQKRDTRNATGRWPKYDRAAPAEPSASELVRRMTALRERQPRPIAKLYGTHGPTPEQAAKHAEDVRAYNNEMAALRRRWKVALERDNAAFRARQVDED